MRFITQPLKFLSDATDGVVNTIAAGAGEVLSVVSKPFSDSFSNSCSQFASNAIDQAEYSFKNSVSGEEATLADVVGGLTTIVPCVKLIKVAGKAVKIANVANKLAKASKLAAGTSKVTKVVKRTACVFNALEKSKKTLALSATVGLFKTAHAVTEAMPEIETKEEKLDNNVVIVTLPIESIKALINDSIQQELRGLVSTARISLLDNQLSILNGVFNICTKFSIKLLKPIRTSTGKLQINVSFRLKEGADHKLELCDQHFKFTFLTPIRTRGIKTQHMTRLLRRFFIPKKIKKQLNIFSKKIKNLPTGVVEVVNNMEEVSLSLRKVAVLGGRLCITAHGKFASKEELFSYNEIKSFVNQHILRKPLIFPDPESKQKESTSFFGEQRIQINSLDELSYNNNTKNLTLIFKVTLNNSAATLKIVVKHPRIIHSQFKFHAINVTCDIDNHAFIGALANTIITPLEITAPMLLALFKDYCYRKLNRFILGKVSTYLWKNYQCHVDFQHSELFVGGCDFKSSGIKIKTSLRRKAPGSNPHAMFQPNLEDHVISVEECKHIFAS